MTVTIHFANTERIILYKVNITMSHFELVLESFGFEGHSKNKYWDYDTYGYVENKALTRILFLSLIKQGYIPFEHINWVDIEGQAGLASFLVT